jgi:hypothetical protein
MLVNDYAPSFPSITGIADTAALCPTGCSMDGLGFDPSMLFTSILGPIEDFWKTKEQSKIAKKQIQFQQQQLKAEKEFAARQSAVDTAESIANQSAQKRQEQSLALVGIVGAALIVSSLFIMGAVKAKKS